MTPKPRIFLPRPALCLSSDLWFWCEARRAEVEHSCSRSRTACGGPRANAGFAPTESKRTPRGLPESHIKAWCHFQGGMARLLFTVIPGIFNQGHLSSFRSPWPLLLRYGDCLARGQVSASQTSVSKNILSLFSPSLIKSK